MKIVRSAAFLASAASYIVFGGVFYANIKDVHATAIGWTQTPSMLVTWQNPAEEAQAPEYQSSGVERAITPDLDFAKQAPLTNSATSNANSSSYVLPITARAKFGLAMDATDTTTGAGNSHLSPSLGYVINDRLAVSVGLDATYFEAARANRLTQDIECIGLQGQDSLPLLACSDAIAYTPANLVGDQGGTVRGNGWGYGYNLGATLAFSDSTHLGMRYQSGVAMDVEDETVFQPAGPTLSTDLEHLTDQAVIAGLGLPQSFAIGASHQFNDQWSVAGDVTWVNWSQFDRMHIASDGSAPTGDTNTENWNNTYRYTLGLNYRHNDRWKYRVGAAYDQSPIPSNQLDRAQSIPADDLIWLAFGVGYSPTPRLSLDVGYAYPFLMQPPVSSGLESSIAGQFQGEQDILSAQFKWRFE
jgi:long-chain fatty acid transport protein